MLGNNGGKKPDSALMVCLGLPPNFSPGVLNRAGDWLRRYLLVACRTIQNDTERFSRAHCFLFSQPIFAACFP